MLRNVDGLQNKDRDKAKLSGAKQIARVLLRRRGDL